MGGDSGRRRFLLRTGFLEGMLAGICAHLGRSFCKTMIRRDLKAHNLRTASGARCNTFRMNGYSERLLLNVIPFHRWPKTPNGKLPEAFTILKYATHPSYAKTNEEMPLNTYNITLRYDDRTAGSEGRTIKVDASSIAGAIGKATRDFVKGLDRKQRFDANKGLRVEAVRAAADAEKEPATATAAAAGSE